MNRFILRWFESFCEGVRGKVESILIKNKRSSQNGLNEAGGFLLDKESVQRAQGVGCLPKFPASRLNLKIGTKLSQYKTAIFGTSGIKKGGALAMKKMLRHDVRNDGRSSTAVGLTIFCVLFSFASAMEAQAQEPCQGGATSQAAIKPLEIGDTIPEELWHLPLQVVNHPEGKETITLNDYRDKKLIILDFWATWCGSCIENIPHITALEKKFSNDFVSVFVNSKKSADTKSKIEAFLTNREKYTGNKLVFSSVLQDTALTELFPYRFIPHYVWLVNGEVIAITSANEVNEENIVAAISGEVESLTTKADIFDFDPKKPLFNYTNAQMTGKRLFQSTFTGYIEGAGKFLGSNIDENKMVWRYYMINQPLLTIVQRGFPEATVPKNRLIIDGDESGVSIFNDSLFCYELIVTPTTNLELRKSLRKDLETHFGLDIKKEKRYSEVWVLSKMKDKKKLRSEGGKSEWSVVEKAKEKYIRNMPISALVSVMNTVSPVPVVDETKIEFPIDIELPADFHQLPMAKSNSYLEKYGLQLQQAEQEVEFTIINFKNDNNE